MCAGAHARTHTHTRPIHLRYTSEDEQHSATEGEGGRLLTMGGRQLWMPPDGPQWAKLNGKCKKVAEMFGGFGNNAYLCPRRM